MESFDAIDKLLENMMTSHKKEHMYSAALGSQVYTCEDAWQSEPPQYLVTHLFEVNDYLCLVL